MQKNLTLLRRLTEENLKGISDHSNSFMENAIEDIIQKISKEYNGDGDKNRKNELMNGMRISMNKIANRIDRGFNFEVRIEPITSEEGKESNDSTESKEILDIQRASKSLQFMKISGQPILRLSEKRKQ